MAIREHSADFRQTASRRHIYGLLAVLVGSWTPVLFDAGAVSSAAELYALATANHPYFVPSQAAVLYLRAPMAAISACLLCLSPGLLLALALRTSTAVGGWVLSGFGLSLVVVSAAAAFGQVLLGEPLRGNSFASVVVLCTTLSVAVLEWRFARGLPPALPFRGNHAGATLLSMLLVSWLFLVVMAPKFYWETFTGDGAHAFETSRLLLLRSLPFWDSTAGDMPGAYGITTMLVVFPSSWFVRLFGECEAAVRLPLVLFLAALYAGILAVIGEGRSTCLGKAERSLIWLGLAIFVVVLAYSVTYDPYSADLALPAARKALSVACFLGFVLAFSNSKPIWICFWGVLACTSSPGGVLLTGLWSLVVAWLWRPRPWSGITASVAVLSAVTVCTVFVPSILAAVNLPAPGTEHNPGVLVRRFTGLQLDEWLRLSFLWEWDYLRRWSFLVLPSGILPAAALFTWRRQDSLTRALAIVAVAYFLIFYVQAFVTLHYFVPAMLLVLVIYWRTLASFGMEQRKWAGLATVLCGVAALYISLPENARPVWEARVVGSAIDIRFGGYHEMDPAVYRRLRIFRHLIPYGDESCIPEERYCGSPIVWNYYAYRHQRVPRKVNYVLQPDSLDPPSGMELLVQAGDAALYVADRTVLAKHRGLRPPTPAGSSIYAIPRDRMFQQYGPSPIELLSPVLKRLGISW